MIDFLKIMKSEIELDKTLICSIESDEEIYPDVRITPISEEWEMDNLGNPRSKRIEFSVSRYLTKSDYVENTKEGISFLESVYKNVKLQNEVIHIGRCKIIVVEIPEQALLEVRGTFTINLYRRLHDGKH